MKKGPVMIEGKLRMRRVYVDIQAAQAVTHMSHRIIVTYSLDTHHCLSVILSPSLLFWRLLNILQYYTEEHSIFC